MEKPPEMDAVDRQQQREIDANKTWVKITGVLSTIVFVGGIALFAMLMQVLNCPHPECPHHHDVQK